jgi:hypothetical protein
MGDMTSKRTFYDILQVAPDASSEVITSAYRTLMTKLKKHPDLGGDPMEAVVINLAYETLSDPARRAGYDAELTARKGTEGQTKAPREERRRAPRRRIDATVTYCLGDDTKWYPGRIKDVSILGVRIQSHKPLFSGQHIVIVPSNLAAAAFHGTVRWTRMFHPSVFERVYEAGVEFTDQITDIDTRLSA